jgi:putative component of toxin-antitoxin plasmid stabilization module
VTARSGSWTPESFVADDGAVPFQRFVDGLPDFKFIALDTAIVRVLSVRGLDLGGSEWLKPMGKGLHEFRVRHDAAEIAHMFGGDGLKVTAPATKILLRVFVHFHGGRMILLLGGYDKGADPSSSRQQREIALARRCLTQFKARRH